MEANSKLAIGYLEPITMRIVGFLIILSGVIALPGLGGFSQFAISISVLIIAILMVVQQLIEVGVIKHG